MSLVLTIKDDEEIVIDGPSSIKAKWHNGHVRVAITADRSVHIVRRNLSEVPFCEHIWAYSADVIGMKKCMVPGCKATRG